MDIKKAINNTNGRIFGVSFIKKNGENRNMCCRLGVRKGVKGVVDRQSEDEKNNTMTVFDFNKKEFRRINLNTIYRVRINKETYNL